MHEHPLSGQKHFLILTQFDINLQMPIISARKYELVPTSPKALLISARILPPQLLQSLRQPRNTLWQNDHERRPVLIPIPNPPFLSIPRINPRLRRCIIILKINLVEPDLGFTEFMVGPGECGTLFARVSEGSTWACDGIAPVSRAILRRLCRGELRCTFSWLRFWLVGLLWLCRASSSVLLRTVLFQPLC